MPQGPNAFVYIFPAVLLAGAALYFGYGALDRVAVSTRQADAIVTGKQFAAGSTTYNTNIVGGRALTQANRNPDAYIVTFVVEGEPTGGAVSRELYDSLQAGDPIHVQYRRTRLSSRIVVTNVSR